MNPISSTESINLATQNLDLLEPQELIETFIEDQFNAVQAVKNAAPEIAKAVELAVVRLELGGRLIYAGAGTSGRLAFLDAAELIPTFSWSADSALVAMAGGSKAVFHAAEGAEEINTLPSIRSPLIQEPQLVLINVFPLGCLQGHIL